jgi:D-alanine-D-alanine ligase
MRIALAYNLKHSGAEAEAEFDTPETIRAMRALIASLGHNVIEVEVSGPVSGLVERLLAARPDLVFNYAEGRIGTFREAFYPALYEQLALPYTGSDAGVLALTLNKSLTKTLLARGPGVLTPGSLLLRDGRALERLPDCPRDLRYPLVVKPNHEGSSKGITQTSVVEDARQLAEVAADRLRRFPAGVLVEEFIDGIDVSVAWFDGLSPRTNGILPPIAYRYQAAGKYRIYELDLKTAGQTHVEAEVPAALDDKVIATLIEMGQRIVVELGVVGYARADFRVTPRGEVYFLEVNPIPSLAPDADRDVYKAAALLGWSSSAIFECIIHAATRRFGIRQERLAEGA